jgi:hypothetical protein
VCWGMVALVSPLYTILYYNYLSMYVCVCVLYRALTSISSLSVWSVCSVGVDSEPLCVDSDVALPW